MYTEFLRMLKKLIGNLALKIIFLKRISQSKVLNYQTMNPSLSSNKESEQAHRMHTLQVLERVGTVQVGKAKKLLNQKSSDQKLSKRRENQTLCL